MREKYKQRPRRRALLGIRGCWGWKAIPRYVSERTEIKKLP